MPTEPNAIILASLCLPVITVPALYWFAKLHIDNALLGSVIYTILIVVGSLWPAILSIAILKSISELQNEIWLYIALVIIPSAWNFLAHVVAMHLGEGALRSRT